MRNDQHSSASTCGARPINAEMVGPHMHRQRICPHAKTSESPSHHGNAQQRVTQRALNAKFSVEPVAQTPTKFPQYPTLDRCATTACIMLRSWKNVQMLATRIQYRRQSNQRMAYNRTHHTHTHKDAHHQEARHSHIHIPLGRRCNASGAGNAEHKLPNTLSMSPRVLQYVMKLISRTV